MIVGTVILGPYKGQRYEVARGMNSSFLRWRMVILIDENGHKTVREIPERFLDQP